MGAVDRKIVQYILIPVWQVIQSDTSSPFVQPYLTKPIHREVRPDVFDGKTCDWQDFLVHFEQVAAWNEWTSGEKAQQLTMCIRGSAQKLLSSLTLMQLSDYNAIKSVLTQRFNPKERSVAFRSEFRNRRQGRDESVTDFGYQLRRLALLAYPEATFASLELHEIDQFLTGLTNFTMKKHIAFAHPQTLEEAIAHGVEYDAVEGNRSKKPEMSDRVAVVSQTSTDEGLTVDAISKLIDQRLEKCTRVPQKSRKYNCFICQDPGHPRDKCPYLAKLGLPGSSVSTGSKGSVGAKTNLGN
ncbi:uncharacterized protein [Haliotis cracherodii]|uniref:uncharacterized protein n=1 Tax=Haliotis cracherodii TaxID=6455 RepID=UPI0039EC7C33